MLNEHVCLLLPYFLTFINPWSRSLSWKSMFFMFHRTFYKSDPTCMQKSPILTFITSLELSQGWVCHSSTHWTLLVAQKDFVGPQPLEKEGVHLQHTWISSLSQHASALPHIMSASLLTLISGTMRLTICYIISRLFYHSIENAWMGWWLGAEV